MARSLEYGRDMTGAVLASCNRLDAVSPPSAWRACGPAFAQDRASRYVPIRRSMSFPSAPSCGIGKGGSSRISSQQDFVVAEGGESRRILDFQAQSGRPGEARAAVRHQRQHAGRAPRRSTRGRRRVHLFSALKPGDEAAVFAFDTRPRSRDARSRRTWRRSMPRSIASIARTARRRSTTRSRKRRERSRPRDRAAGAFRSAAQSWCSPTASTRAAVSRRNR